MLLALFQNQPEALPPAKRSQMIAYALESLDVATQSNTLNYFNHNTSAKLLQLETQSDYRIAQHLRRSLEINPYQLDIRLALADFMEANGKPEQAQTVLVNGLNKSYISNINQVTAFWRKLAKYTAGSTPYKQRINSELEFFDAQPLDNRDELYIYTLPDLGWRPNS